MNSFSDAGWIGVDLLRPARRVLGVSSAATYLVIQGLSQLAEALRQKYAFVDIVLRGDRVSIAGVFIMDKIIIIRQMRNIKNRLCWMNQNKVGIIIFIIFMNIRIYFLELILVNIIMMSIKLMTCIRHKISDHHLTHALD